MLCRYILGRRKQIPAAVTFQAAALLWRLTPHTTSTPLTSACTHTVTPVPQAAALSVSSAPSVPLDNYLSTPASPRPKRPPRRPPPAVFPLHPHTVSQDLPPTPAPSRRRRSPRRGEPPPRPAPLLGAFRGAAAPSGGACRRGKARQKRRAVPQRGGAPRRPGVRTPSLGGGRMRRHAPEPLLWEESGAVSVCLLRGSCTGSPPRNGGSEGGI